MGQRSKPEFVEFHEQLWMMNMMGGGVNRGEPKPKPHVEPPRTTCSVEESKARMLAAARQRDSGTVCARCGENGASLHSIPQRKVYFGREKIIEFDAVLCSTCARELYPVDPIPTAGPAWIWRRGDNLLGTPGRWVNGNVERVLPTAAIVGIGRNQHSVPLSWVSFTDKPPEEEPE